MKIALVSPYDFPYPGGVTEHIMALAKGLEARGHDVQIIAACSGYKGKRTANTRAVANGVTSIPVGGTVARVGLSPFSYRRIKKILREEAFEVIHLHEPLTPSIAWLVLLQTEALPQTVTVGTFHAYHEQPNWFYLHGRPIFGKFFAKLDSLIAVSKPAHAFANRMFPGDYRIIPNGIDLNRFGKDTSNGTTNGGRRSETVTLLFVGRLDKRKGFPNLLKAFIKLKKNYPHLSLKVVGPFEPESCRRVRHLTRTQGVTDIEFTGYVSPERLPEIYQTADIFCAPSIGFESFGIVLLEAMAAGLPVVASDIAGYRSVISPGQEGLLVPPGRSGALADTLRQLLENVDLRRSMGRRGWLKAQQYNWETIVDQILQVYQETIERKMKSRRAFTQATTSGIHLKQRQVNPEGKSC